ncbi:Retrovirus-related Pol polyprotein from transposon TNT 1-94 [Vitis vinifera]|uniref:Retrovirus-related Pol polyprotein from transposon TNT 1-94 n=1 Tax=Vitis vinifera TaxID=29760 RepID=A0A438I705_VITVI|nr:Retrovirus-related Pol polyprotein from transposon TNT 1-94 [Vitis vinifera]
MRHCQPLVFHATPSAAGIPCDAVSHWLTCDVVTPFKCAVLEPVWRSQKLAPPMPSLDHISGGFRTVFCLRRPSASQSDARDVLSGKRRLHFGLRCRSWRHLAIGEGCLKWKEHVIIVLGCMDLDYALREDRPADLTSVNTAEQRTQGTKVRVVRRHTCALGLDLSTYTIQSIQDQLQHTQKEKWTLNELIAQCVQEEERLKQEKIESAHLVSTSQGYGTSKKRKRDNKGKQTAFSGASKQKVQKKQDKEITCFFCMKAGHMKKTCTKYAAWCENKSTLLNLVCSEINLAIVPIDTWWIDTGATTHISVTMQGCLRSRMPIDGERYIYVGNGNKAAVKVIGLFRLQLDSGFCIECIKGKQTNVRKKDVNRCGDVLELIHTDICGPFSTPSWNGQQYFITFIDDYSRYNYLYLIHEKSQSLDVFKNFKAEVENQLSKKIKAVRSNRGGEYYGRYDGFGEQRLGPFAKYLMECGIVPQYTLPRTSSQNGVAERRNRTLKDMVRRYSKRLRGFKFYDPSTRSFFETGNAKFIEDVELSGRESLRKVVFEEESVSVPIIAIGHGHIMFDNTVQNVQPITEIEDTPEIPPTQVEEPVQVHEEEHEFDMGLEDDPISVSQVKQSFDSEKWIEAMKDEMKSMKDNGDIIRYKARLIAKGFTQKEGIDYKETFSPVSSKDSFRIIMALVAHYDLELHQMDVKTAFLNGNIDETIYMVQPENFESNDSKQLIYRDCSRGILGLSQKSYINKKDMERFPYASAVGSLMYAQVCTRPDIAYIVGMLGRYLSNPSMDHWKKTKRVMWYLQRTKDYMLTYRRSSHLEIVGYLNSNFAGCLDSRRSTSGYIFMLAGGAVSWKSLKQTLIASSTMEAKFIACYEASNHGI